MKFALRSTGVLFVSLALFTGPCSAEDADRVKQIDRVCVGRMLIVQTMAMVKESGKSEEDYRNENPFDPKWNAAMRHEVSDVIHYVWSHSHDENIDFSNAVMQVCYEKNTES